MKKFRLLLLVALLPACEAPDLASPLPDEAPRLLSMGTDRAFYYHQGKPVFVRPDYNQVVIAKTENFRLNVFQGILENLDVTIVDRHSLPQIAHHDVLSLAGNLVNGPAAVAALRNQPGVEFAAPTYTLDGSQEILYLVNELVVHFGDAVSSPTIDSLVNAMGAEIVRRPLLRYGFEEYRLSYPRGEIHS